MTGERLSVDVDPQHARCRHSAARGDVGGGGREEARVNDADTRRFALSMTLVELTVWLLALLLVVR